MSEAVFDIEQEEPNEVEIPSTLAVLPLKETVVFPGSLTPLAIGQERSVRLVDDVVSDEPRILALVTVRTEDVEEPGWDDLYEIGTAAIVDKMIKVPDGTLRILVRGLERIRLDRRTQEEPYLAGEFTKVPDVVVESDEVEALMRNVQTLFQRIIELVPYLPEELQVALANVDEPTSLVNFVASLLRIKTEEKQRLLELENVEERLRELLRLLNRELELLELGSRIQSQMQSEMEKGQREFFLRQQLRAIQEELGEGDEQQAEIAELRAQIEEAELPEDVHKAATRELSRLEKLPPAAAEYGVIRTYLDWILSLPWSKTTEDNLDLEHARRDPGRGPLRPGEGQGPDHRVPGRREAQERRLRAHPLLRRPARASARPRSASRSRARSGASSCASPSAECATRRRYAAIGGRTWARCPERSSARCAMPSRRTRCS